MEIQNEAGAWGRLAERLRLSGYLLDKPELSTCDVLENLLDKEAHGTKASRLLAGMLGILREGHEDLTEVQAEYARLFVGPFAMLAPPYAGLYLSGEKSVNNAVAREIAAIYAEAGLVKNPAHKTLPDYAATELEFLYYLAYQFLWTGGRVYLRLYQNFYETYVKSWCGRWLEDVEARAETKYYRLFAAYMRLLVRRAGMLYVA